MSAFYAKSIQRFLGDSTDSIVGILTLKASDAGFVSQYHSQADSWQDFINLMKETAPELANYGINLSESSILLEYPIPRREKRIDCVLLVNDLVIVIEFKDHEARYTRADTIQVEDYALDLRDFHLQSKDRTIIPILLASDATDLQQTIVLSNDCVQATLYASRSSIANVLRNVIEAYSNQSSTIPLQEWDDSAYQPTPTIIEAARALYAGQSVASISRADAGVKNLTRTSDAVIELVSRAKRERKKIICFITGVPGAGKTLAGLNIIHSKELSPEGEPLGVFLSGNGPLVRVLRESLARDKHDRTGVTLRETRREVEVFVQNVHKFLDDLFKDKSKIPPDHVVVFDEAQRAWDAAQSRKKFKRDFSEAEMMLEIMDRREDWAVIVALVGGGQEINDGEAGLPEWGLTLQHKFPHWEIAVSPELASGEYSAGDKTLFETPPDNVRIIEDTNLHLRVSLRSFRASELSLFVSNILTNEPHSAAQVLEANLRSYPIYLTRSLREAKKWLRSKQRGSRRTGLVATSGARRLRPLGLDVKSEIQEAHWFLDPDDDVRSSYALEVPATEFSIQGLELDWVCLCWDCDLRRTPKGWSPMAFKGPAWQSVRQAAKQEFVLNKYRVLLTRAREGLIIYVPNGSKSDATRPPKVYDAIYDFLLSCGIPELTRDHSSTDLLLSDGADDDRLQHARI